ncbi:MAG TPA: carboxypeptidase-like regulatory domain-containing protein, partial [Kofleriaceae bacterium]|nr:carboxypeptidase-like regulatory domain-containing protein [Kofleriaceae bacterium]
REGVAVAGTVVDPAGRPVEGARVTVESTNSYWDLSDQRLDAVITDARGRWEHTGLARQTFRFRAFHPELAPGLSEPVSLADGAGRDDVVIRLELGGRISGRVVDAAGAPVPGARVQAASSDLRSGPVRRAHADADGRFLLSGLPRAEVSLIAADRDASSAMLSLDLSERHQRDGVELRLALDGVIAGTVVTSKGDEVGEARVIATPFLDDSFGESLEQRLRGQTSDVADQAGHFRLTGLAPGRYRVRAIRPGSSAELLQMKPGATADVGTAGVKVVVDDLTSMSGQVRFRSGGIPKLFSVRLGASAARSFAGADGRFRLDEVPAGKQFVTISGPELVMVHRADVTLTAGEDNDLGMIDVDRGRTVRGRVTSGGAPVAGAQVVLGAEILGDGWSVMPFKDRAERLGVKQAVTDADGSYTMTGIGPLDQEVIAERDGVGRSVATEVPPGTADLTINLAVEPFGSLSGHLRLNGKPTSGLIFMRPTTAANMNFMVNSGSDGAYHFDRLGPGSYVAFGVLETHGGSGGGEGGTGRTIAIRSGATATADFDINKGTLEVTVRLTSAGDVVQFGYAVLCKLPPGPVPHMPATIGDARRFLTEMVGGDIYEGFMVKDRQRVFTEIAPGSYGACVAPLTGPPDDPDVIARMQADVIHTPIYCKTFTVTDGPPQQGVTVEVQPAP